MGVAGWTCLHMGGVATGDVAGRAVPAVPPSELGSAAAEVLAVGTVSLLAASDSVEEGPLTHAAENIDWKEGNYYFYSDTSEKTCRFLHGTW